MIDRIDRLLQRWAAWAASGQTRLGYPRQSAFMAPSRHGGAVAEIDDDSALAIERAVRALEPKLYEVVWLFYLKMRSCTTDEIARQCGCCSATVYHRLHRAHLALHAAIYG